MGRTFSLRRSGQLQPHTAGPALVGRILAHPPSLSGGCPNRVPPTCALWPAFSWRRPPGCWRGRGARGGRGCRRPPHGELPSGGRPQGAWSRRGSAPRGQRRPGPGPSGRARAPRVLPVGLKAGWARGIEAGRQPTHQQHGRPSTASRRRRPARTPEGRDAGPNEAIRRR